MDGEEARSIGDDRAVNESVAEVAQRGEGADVATIETNEAAAAVIQSAKEEGGGKGSSGTDAGAVTTGGAIVSTTSPVLANATAAKKFNSLSVAKQFFQKASPTTANANVAATATPSSASIANSSPQSSSSRLSTSMPSSRLTTAKLSGIKPSSPGWAHLPTPSAGQGHSAATPSIDAVLHSAGDAGSAADPGTAKLVGGAAGNTASPRLVTALARSTSPHVKNGEGSKGSPGLRNAALSGLGRSTSPATTAFGASSTTTSSSRAPWASVKAGNLSSAAEAPSRSRGIARPSEFPTAAEAAQAKAEAERREKAAAAEAAARADQALQKLESFRGTTLGEGNQWDEMDDDLDEVMEFDGSGPIGKVPEEPVTKEERFKDVSHDRSWPQRSGETRSTAARKIVDVSAEGTAPQIRPYQAAKPKVETMAVHSGEGISLDTMPNERTTAPWGYSNREHKASSGGGGGGGPRRSESGWGDESGGGSTARHSTQQSGTTSSSTRGIIATAAPAASARAWGPLAQRQASLNPNAPKPAAKVEPTKATQEADEKRSVQVQAKPAVKSSDAIEKSTTSSTVGPKQGSSSATAMREGRALPPHLAATAAAKAQAASLREREEEADSQASQVESNVAARPYGSLIGSNRSAAAQDGKLSSEQVTAAPVDQRDEMLSAAERARKRRQAEEEERQKERERALAKAQAIEQKMREEQDRAEREAEERRQAAQKARKPVTVDTAVGRRAATSGAAEGVLSPQSASDDAKSWRRAEDKSTAKTSRSGESDGPRVLLRRPSASNVDANEKRGGVAQHDKSSTTETAAVPTGPRANREKRSNGVAQDGGLKFEKLERGARKPRGARVEIIAPTDADADKHNEKQRQKERESNVNGSQAPLAGVLKPSNSVQPKQAPVRAAAVQEDQSTRREVMFDPVPVWNRFVVRLSRAGSAHSKAPFEAAKAQKARIVRFQKDEQVPSKVNILSWEPPLPALSMRTLSRDDQFFPKKYRKGVVISNVVVPRKSIETFAADRAIERQREAAERAARPLPSAKSSVGYVQSQSLEDQVNELERAFSASTLASAQPSVKVPTASKLLDDRQSGAFSALGGTQSRSLSRPGDGVLRSEFASSDASQLLNEGARQQPVVSLRSSGQPSLSPSHGLSSTTWGEGSLTFAGLESSGGARERNAAAADERNRIKDVWSSSSNAGRSTQRPLQNSLEGINDEFPSTMSMINALDSDIADELARNNSFQRNVARPMPTIVRSTKSETTHLYSPLDRKTTSDANASMTTSSSPLANGGVHAGDVGANKHDALRVRSQSPSSSMRAFRSSTHGGEFGNGQTFVQRDRSGVRSAFGPYAYPEMYSMQSAYGSAYGGGLDSGSVNSNYRQTQYGGGGFGGGGGGGHAGNRYASNQSRYRGNNGNINGGLHNFTSGGGFDDVSGAASYTNGMSESGDYAMDRGAGSMGADGNGEYNAEYGTVQNPAGSAAAGWPLDSPITGNMTTSYGSSPSNYHMPATGLQSYVPQHRQQQQQQQQQYYMQQRPAYHGRTPSSNYRSYNNGGGHGQYSRQMASRGGGGGGNYYGGYGSTASGVNVGMDLSGAGGHGSAHHHSSSLQATAKPFQAGSKDTDQASSPRPDAQDAAEGAHLQQGQEAQSAQQYAGYNAAVW